VRTTWRTLASTRVVVAFRPPPRVPPSAKWGRQFTDTPDSDDKHEKKKKKTTTSRSPLAVSQSSSSQVNTLIVEMISEEKYPRSSIEDDFNYGTSVASASVQIRMGESRHNMLLLRLCLCLCLWWWPPPPPLLARVPPQGVLHPVPADPSHHRHGRPLHAVDPLKQLVHSRWHLTLPGPPSKTPNPTWSP